VLDSAWSGVEYAWGYLLYDRDGVWSRIASILKSGRVSGETDLTVTGQRERILQGRAYCRLRTTECSTYPTNIRSALIWYWIDSQGRTLAEPFPYPARETTSDEELIAGTKTQVVRERLYQRHRVFPICGGRSVLASVSRRGLSYSKLGENTNDAVWSHRKWQPRRPLPAHPAGVYEKVVGRERTWWRARRPLLERRTSFQEHLRLDSDGKSPRDGYSGIRRRSMGASGSMPSTAARTARHTLSGIRRSHEVLAANWFPPDGKMDFVPLQRIRAVR
jgi:hypothetical protein